MPGSAAWTDAAKSLVGLGSGDSPSTRRLSRAKADRSSRFQQRLEELAREPTEEYEQSILPSIEESGEFIRALPTRPKIEGGHLENASGIVREELLARFPGMSEEQVHGLVSKIQSLMSRQGEACQGCTVK